MEFVVLDFVYSSLINQSGRISRDLFHVTDWLPTLVSLAGGNLSNVTFLDGVDQWSTLQNMAPNQRNEILLNIYDVRWENEALREGSWKIIKQGY